MIELYKVLITKEDGKRYVDLYLCWFYKKVRYERVSPTFKGFPYRTLFSRAIEVKSVQEMKDRFSKEFGVAG